jgi:hypothetical protein
MEDEESDSLRNSARPGVTAKVSRNLKTWMEYWSAITFSPRKYAETFGLPLTDSIKLFATNIVIGMCVSLLISCAYWSVSFARDHWKEYIGSMIFVSVGPIILATVSAIVFIFPSIPAWAAFRWTSGRGTLAGHVSRFLVCSNLEWVSAIFYAAVLLLHDADSDIKYPYILKFSESTKDIMVNMSLFFAGGIRVYYLWLQSRILYVYHYGKDEKVHLVAPGVLVILGLAAAAAYEFTYVIWLVVATANLD